MIKVHTTLAQFNSEGCSKLTPTNYDLTPNYFGTTLITPFILFIN
jgi:hypothetical protein